MSYVRQQGFSIYGDGADGDVVISSNTTLTSDMVYNSLVVNSGITLNSSNYMIRAKNSVLVLGTISCAGGNSPGVTAGITPVTGTWGSGSNGGAGGSTGAGTAGTVIGSLALGGAGGSGGSGAGGAGGSGGTASAPGPTNGGAQIVKALPYAAMPNLPGFSNRLQGGAGGGGGGGSAGGAGGGGGGGGGVVWIASPKIYGSGTISAKGGDGGNANGSGNGGGGGSGGGGRIITISGNDPTVATAGIGTLTFNVSPGAMGAKAGTGSNGVTGSIGFHTKLINAINGQG